MLIEYHNNGGVTGVLEFDIDNSSHSRHMQLSLYSLAEYRYADIIVVVRPTL